MVWKHRDKYKIKVLNFMRKYVSSFSVAGEPEENEMRERGEENDMRGSGEENEWK